MGSPQPPTPPVAAAIAGNPAPAAKPAPECAFAETHWKAAEDMKLVAIYQDHLTRFPNCPFAALARQRIEALQRR
jgi:hypothetical protein